MIRGLVVLKRGFTVSLSLLDVFSGLVWVLLFGLVVLFCVLLLDIQSLAHLPALQQIEIS